MTIICCLPVYRSRYFGICSLLSGGYICAYATTRDGPPQLCRLGSRAERFDYALTCACFHAGEICVLDFFDRRNLEDVVFHLAHHKPQRPALRIPDPQRLE